MEEDKEAGIKDDHEPRSRTMSNAFSYLNLDANKVLSAFGKFGRYQMMAYLITNSVSMLYAISMMVMPFVTETPKFNCRITEPEGANWVYRIQDECHIYDGNNWTISCLNIPGAVLFRYCVANNGFITQIPWICEANILLYEYEHQKVSLASDFNLVCDDQNQVEHGSSIFLLGGMLISPVITQLSDLFGRRVTFLAPLYISVVSNIICAFAPNYTIFLFFRFVAGVATTSFSTIGLTLSLESVSTKFRNYMPIVGNITWVIGYLLAGVLKLFINDWRYLYLAASMPGLLTIPFYWMTPESIHWLITNRKKDGVQKYIMTSSRINRTTIQLHECTYANGLDSPKRKVKKRTAADIFKTPALLFNLLLNAFILIVMSLTYWGISLFSTELGDNKMTGFFLSGIVELPAALLASIMIFYLNRKTVSFISLAVQALAMLTVPYCPEHTVWSVILPLVAKTFNTVAWSSQTMLYSEAAPTSVRNVFTGLVSFLGDIGSVLAPYLKRLEAIDDNAPMMLIAVMSLVASVFVLALPETRNKELPEDIDDDSYDPGPLLRCFWKRRAKKMERAAVPMMDSDDSQETIVSTPKQDC